MKPHDELTPGGVLAKRQKRLQNGRNVWLTILELLGVMAAIALLFLVMFGLASVDGDSMRPTFDDGDLVMYYRLNRSYAAGDVIAFRTEGGEQFIKRVVAVGGDTVSMVDGKVYINNAPESTETYYDTFYLGSAEEFTVIVPEGMVFVLGDHRTNSKDSRELGCISLKDVRGKIIFAARTRFW